MLIYETFALTFDTLVHLLPKKILSIYFGSLNIRCFKVFLTWYLYFDLTVQPSSGPQSWQCQPWRHVARLAEINETEMYWLAP